MFPRDKYFRVCDQQIILFNPMLFSYNIQGLVDFAFLDMCGYQQLKNCNISLSSFSFRNIFNPKLEKTPPLSTQTYIMYLLFIPVLESNITNINKLTERTCNLCNLV